MVVAYSRIHRCSRTRGVIFDGRPVAWGEKPVQKPAGSRPGVTQHASERWLYSGVGRAAEIVVAHMARVVRKCVLIWSSRP